MLASHVKHEDWHSCWKIFKVHCFRPFQNGTTTKRKTPPISFSEFTFRSSVFLFRDGVGNQRRCTPFHSLEKSRSVTSFAGLAWPLCARMTRTTSDRCWMYGSRKQVPLAAAAVVVWVPGDTQVMSQSKAPGWLRCFSWLPWIEGDGSLSVMVDVVKEPRKG